MAELLCIGISHKTASLVLRERLSLSDGRARQLMLELTAAEEIQESVALSTCNRTELYVITADPLAAESTALGALARRAETPATELALNLYTHRGSDAVGHLLRVAGGLESMVFGEHEILGQIKRSHAAALAEAVSGPVSDRLFASAVAAGRRVRSETAVGAGHLSVATTAVDLATRTLGELDGRTALIVGSGENGEMMARALGRAGAASIFIANRHYDRAIGLAAKVGGRALRFELFPQELLRADIVVGSTGSPHTLIHREELQAVMRERTGRPLLILDTALPRDIDPAVRDLPGVTLLDLDDLQRSVERSESLRRGELDAAEAIVAEEVAAFGSWLTTLDVLPTVAALHRRGSTIAAQVIEENASHFAAAGDADRRRLELMAEAIVTRLLHEPSLRLRQSAGSDQGTAQMHALRELFALDQPTGSEQPADAPPADLEQHQRGQQ
jgi:glutamyl-tRNA reductase